MSVFAWEIIKTLSDLNDMVDEPGRLRAVVEAETGEFVDLEIRLSIAARRGCKARLGSDNGLAAHVFFDTP